MTPALFAEARKIQTREGTYAAALFLMLRAVPIQLAVAALTGRTA